MKSTSHTPHTGEKERTVSGDMLVMNKAEMEALGANFRQQAEAVERIIAAIDGGIQATNWQGRRAEEFRGLWESQFKRNLLTLRDSLGEHAAFIGRERLAAINALDGGVG
ncbi:MAG: WXG100 family type VII secretion target [Actinomycetota bacterium]